MKTPRRYIWALSFACLLLLAGRALVHAGLYGWTIFTLFPMILGGITAWVYRPATAVGASSAGAFSVLAACCLLLLLGWEGAICILMSAPLSLPLGALGGYFAYRAGCRNVAAPGVTLLLLLPASLSWDIESKPPVFCVHTSIVVAAPPEQVWKHVVVFPDLPKPHEWFFRTGLAYPKRAHIDGTGVGAIRQCEFSTGSFVEPIEIWDEPRLLQFRVTENPAPLEEWTPFRRIESKHMHGYLISKQGQFRLTRLTDGRTLLEGTTWYQHGLWPAQYWRWWCDAIIHRIHLQVLNHVRALSEHEGAPRW